MLEVVPKPVETVHFRGELAAVGSFRCAVDDPLYRNSGPCSYHTFAFPRTATGIRYDNGLHFVGTPNSVSFYNQEQVYFRDPIAPVDATDWYVVSDRVLIDAIRAYDEGVDEHRERPFPFATGPATSAVYMTQRALFDSLQTMSALAIEEGVLSILDDVLRAAFRARPQESPRMHDAVEHAKGIIADDPARLIKLGDLARRAGCSPFHLCRAFRQATGLTITAFRRSMRLRLALDRLRAGHDDLTSLAFDLGFASHSHFTAAFRRQFGLTPSRFRAIS